MQIDNEFFVPQIGSEEEIKQNKSEEFKKKFLVGLLVDLFAKFFLKGEGARAT